MRAARGVHCRNPSVIIALSGRTLSISFRSILKGFLSKDFLTPVAALSDGLVSATLEVYGKVAREMLPTPSRPHYTFNLRDISKVIQVSDLHPYRIELFSTVVTCF